MAVSTARILEVYSETGSYGQTASILGMQYDAVRKRLKRSDTTPIVPGKSILYDQDGNPKQTWATGKGLKGPTAEEFAEAVAHALKGFKPPTPLKTSLKGETGLLAIWPLADLHMGMRAWGDETGGIDWDISIATKAYQAGISEVTDLTPKAKQGVVLVAGDLAHADNYHQTTTNPASHHMLDVDGRYPKMIDACMDIVVYATERAKERAERVVVVVIPGNHDGAASVGVRLALAMYYRNDKRVTVDRSPSPYWWYEWGQCMFGCTHGDKVRVARLGNYMSDKMSEMWGRTKHRYAFTGHFHKKLVEDQPGVRVEILPCPAPQDSYASGMGFNSPRIFESKVYHKERGLRLTRTVIL